MIVNFNCNGISCRCCCYCCDLDSAGRFGGGEFSLFLFVMVTERNTDTLLHTRKYVCKTHLRDLKANCYLFTKASLAASSD